MEYIRSIFIQSNCMHKVGPYGYIHTVLLSYCLDFEKTKVKIRNLNDFILKYSKSEKKTMSLQYFTKYTSRMIRSQLSTSLQANPSAQRLLQVHIFSPHHSPLERPPILHPCLTYWDTIQSCCVPSSTCLIVDIRSAFNYTNPSPSLEYFFSSPQPLGSLVNL